jgi:hypothetical protein
MPRGLGTRADCGSVASGHALSRDLSEGIPVPIRSVLAAPGDSARASSTTTNSHANRSHLTQTLLALRHADLVRRLPDLAKLTLAAGCEREDRLPFLLVDLERSEPLRRCDGWQLG